MDRKRERKQRLGSLQESRGPEGEQKLSDRAKAQRQSAERKRVRERRE